MFAFKEIRKANDDTIIIKIPEELRNKNIEIILLPSDEIMNNDDSNNIEDDLMFDKIQIDTKKWKFNRNEIYE